ncbi:bifunctional oligoribonuclease/PAP phosphatase NrnA [Patescibacteria group bacterium]
MQNSYSNELSQIKQKITEAKDILIVTHEKPNADSIGCSLALYLAIKSLGKNVVIACPDPMIVELSNFVGANKVISSIGKKNFIVSLDYVEGAIEKVSYNIEGNKFNLVIEPREGFPPFTSDNVQYTQGGNSPDVIICVDTIHLGGLKDLYEGDKNLYASKPVINIDRHPNNVNYGQINLVDSKSSTTAELVGQVINYLGASVTEDIATNLLNAVYGGTNTFSYSNISAGAFELAAQCIKAGGKRFKKQQIDNKSVSPKIQIPKAHDQKNVQQYKTEQPIMKDIPNQPQEQKKQQDAPADWLKPKIFKSSNT